MRKASSLIARIRSLGASISSDGTRLSLKAPRGAITSELHEEIARFRPAIVAELIGETQTTSREGTPTKTISEIANLLATAYRRFKPGSGGVKNTADSGLANSHYPSVHGVVL